MHIKQLVIGTLSASAILISAITPAFAVVSITPTPSNKYTSDQAPLYGPNAKSCSCSVGGVATTSTFGFASIWNQLDGKVHAFVSIKNGLPNTGYSISIHQSSGGCTPSSVGNVFTNQFGFGSGSFETPWVNGATKFWVSAAGGKQNLASPARNVYFGGTTITL